MCYYFCSGMISITNLSRKNPPVGGPKNNWKRIKDEVLGKQYDLSLVFSTGSLMKKLNNRYCAKDQPTSVLAFPLSKKQGEIFINLNLSREDHSPIFLFIHALLHLKNFPHGVRMKEQEMKLMKKYSNDTRYRNRP